MWFRSHLFSCCVAIFLLWGCFASANAQSISTLEHLRRAGQFLQANEPAKAIPELQAVVAAEPSNIDAQANLGVLLYFQQQPSAAEEHLRVAVTAQPGLSKIRGLLGLSELAQGKADAAHNDLALALPDLQEAAFRKQVGLSIVEIDTQQQRLADATAVVQLLQKSAPEDPEIQYAAYRVYTDLAGDSLLSLSLTAPKSGQMQQAIAHELLRVRDYPGAIASFRRAIQIDPKLPGVHTELAETLRASPDEADRAAAEGEYKLAVEQDSRDVLAAVRLGDMRADAGDRADASDYYRHALSMQPNNADAEIGMAHIDSDEGHTKEAVARLKSVLVADPSNLLAHFRLSALYRQMHQPEDAKRELAEYQKLKQLKENLREVYSTMKLRAPGADMPSGMAGPAGASR
jgi:Tfp pilus assembly protein PilF